MVDEHLSQKLATREREALILIRQWRRVPYQRLGRRCSVDAGIAQRVDHGFGRSVQKPEVNAKSPNDTELAKFSALTPASCRFANREQSYKPHNTIAATARHQPISRDSAVKRR